MPAFYLDMLREITKEGQDFRLQTESLTNILVCFVIMKWGMPMLSAEMYELLKHA
jgi:hypothetical protein